MRVYNMQCKAAPEQNLFVTFFGSVIDPRGTLQSRRRALPYPISMVGRGPVCVCIAPAAANSALSQKSRQR